MKKIRLFLSALALVIAFTAAAVGFATETEVFKLVPETGALKVPHEIVTNLNYICDQEQDELWCTQEYEVNSSDQPIAPAGDPVMGRYSIQ